MHEHESMRSKLLVPNLPVYRLLNQYLSACVYGAPFVKKNYLARICDRFSIFTNN